MSNNQEHNELQACLNLLIHQWNIINSMKDDNKRIRHLARLELFINHVQTQLDSIIVKNNNKIFVI